MHSPAALLCASGGKCRLLPPLALLAHLALLVPLALLGGPMAAGQAPASCVECQVPRPSCVPCQPSAPAEQMNCNCQQMTTVSIPTIPMVDRCLAILAAVCQQPAAAGGSGRVDEFIKALADTTRCFVRLTSVNFNFTDADEMKKTSAGRSGARLLEQLLGGLGNSLDTLLAGLLGNGAGGGLLGQVLG